MLKRETIQIISLEDSVRQSLFHSFWVSVSSTWKASPDDSFRKQLGSSFENLHWEIQFRFNFDSPANDIQLISHAPSDPKIFEVSSSLLELSVLVTSGPAKHLHHPQKLINQTFFGLILSGWDAQLSTRRGQVETVECEVHKIQL